MLPFLFVRVGALAAAALAVSAPASAELTRSNDSGFVSRHAVVVKAEPKEVWLALISPASWWQSEHTWSGDAKNLTLTPQAGGCFCETIPEVDEPGRFTLQGSVEHMRVVQAYPEQALRMQGALGPLQSEPVMGVLTIVISKVDAGTRIVWEYNVGGPMRYEVPVISKVVDGVMGVQLAALAKGLGPVEPSQSDAHSERGAPQTDGVSNADTDAPAASKIKIKPAAQSSGKAIVAASPALQPDTKPASVNDAFGDLEDMPKR